MSKLISTSLLCPVVSDISADRLLDDCALDETFGVLRRSIPRTYAGRVTNPQVSGLPDMLCRWRRSIAGLRSVVSHSSFSLGSDIGHLARQAALFSGLVAAVVAIFISMMQHSGATAHVASGFLSFATVFTVTVLVAFPALHLLRCFGIDLRESFVGDSDKQSV